MKLGIDVLLGDPQLKKSLQGRRLALLAHPASMSQTFSSSIDALAACPELKLTAAFGPQHGMRGEKQDNMVESDDYLDPVHQIPVFSLYGDVRVPTAQMLDAFDVLLVDIQDVGTRVYTFLTTLMYVLQACGKAHKAVWILDRPNPAGRPVEGSLLGPEWTSFVGAAEFPMRHGLTLGEAAHWFVKNKQINVEYKVIAMEGYRPDQGPEWGWPASLPWVNPSPNAASLNMARCYPGTVLLEGTYLSEARGTTRPLEILGAPGLDTGLLLHTMEKLAPTWLEGCRLRPCYFQPTFQKHAGQICAGFQIHVDEAFYQHEKFKPYRLIALSFKALRLIQPDYLLWRDFHYEYEKDRLAIDLIAGGSFLREWVDEPQSSISDLDRFLLKDERLWIESRAEFLLY